MYKVKKVLLFLFISFFQINFAQSNWKVTVIDSFQTTNVGQGIWGLNSLFHENTIHFTYFYHDQNSETFLFYSMKTGSSFTVDTVATITGFNSYQVSTSLQFNNDGSKWIYAGFYSYPNRIIGVYKQKGDDWDFTPIDETGDIKTVVSIQNNIEMGFAYVGIGNFNNLQSIKYAYWNNDKWEITNISKRNDTYKTKPSIIEAGGKIYLVYGEGRYPDSLITRVYVKENQSWQISFSELLEIPYGGGSVGGLQTFIGISNPGNPYMLHTLSNEVLPRFYELVENNWVRRTINYPTTTYLTKGLCGSNILFDESNTLLMISQNNGFGSIISWVKENGDADLADVPYKHIVSLQDYAMLNNEIYIYYYDGYREWPYNRPATFKEVSIKIDDLVTDVNDFGSEVKNEFILSQNYPNPFNPSTRIKYSIPHSLNVKLTIYDSIGREIQTLVNKIQRSGNYEIEFNADNLASGIYIYKIIAGNQSLSKKMAVIK